MIKRLDFTRFTITSFLEKRFEVSELTMQCSRNTYIRHVHV